MPGTSNLIKNTRLTEFEATRELVLHNSVPRPAQRRHRKHEANKTLFEFGSG